MTAEVLGVHASLDAMEPVVYSTTFVENAVRGREKPSEWRDAFVKRFIVVRWGPRRACNSSGARGMPQW